MNRRHEKSNTNAIRELNDVLRTTFVGGAVMITAGVAALEAGTRGRLLQAIRRFDGFSATDDPYGEHDFGAVELDGQTYSSRSTITTLPSKAIRLTPRIRVSRRGS